MEYLILRAKFTQNHRELPADWPVKANPYKGGDVPQNWEVMTEQEFTNLRNQLKEKYDEWERAKGKEKAKEEERKKQKERDHQLKCRNKLVELGFEEEEIKILMSKNYPE